jgi:hypothetical protein
LRDIARLLGKMDDLRLEAECVLQVGHDFREGDGVLIAEVDHLIGGCRVLHRRTHTLDNIRNVSVIAPGSAVAEQFELLVPEHAARKPVNGQVGALARPVGGEEPKRNEAGRIQVRVNVTHQFAGDFSAGVRTDRPEHRFVFTPRDIWIDAVHTGRGSKDELPDAAILREFEQTLRSGDIDVLIEIRVLDRRPDSCPRSEVNHHVDGVTQLGLKSVTIPDIGLD